MRFYGAATPPVALCKQQATTARHCPFYHEPRSIRQRHKPPYISSCSQPEPDLARPSNPRCTRDRGFFLSGSSGPAASLRCVIVQHATMQLVRKRCWQPS